ncbi:hypothetical protein LCGC14_1365800 [marine sediment metagenome]|uniref:DNA methylase N-4/N-6 domain-containing protein n=1 Tax=marine sediment metagenome TaxID=412755 RepID=A0A0F9MM18_9ZZZZ
MCSLRKRKTGKVVVICKNRKPKESGRMQVNTWTNCYDGSWKDVIVPEAFSHPAKMSYGLLKRILDHAKGWLNKGDVIVDPFGGIGSTGILGAYEGYQVVCCELEQKFVDLAKQNFELHKDAWVEFGNPYPIILQGDSRRLCEVVGKADCIVSSPPFSVPGSQIPNVGGDRPVRSRQREVPDRPDNYGSTPGQLGAMKPGKVDMVVSSPPYAEALGNRSHEGDPKKYYERQKRYNEAHPEHKRPSAESMCYPATPGQLGNLKSGDVDAIISSPPYQGSIQTDGDGIDWSKIKEGGTNKTLARAAAGTGYGKTKGQLADLKSGDVDCVISSPPFEKTTSDKPSRNIINGGLRMGKFSMGNGYGQAEGNIGNEQGDTFWQAAKTIVEQCHQILKPGGHAIWVVKSFVRKKKIVDFPGDWLRLCESVGFKTVCIHHAMLVKETSHKTLFGHTEVKRKERKSFFRRLAESKGSPRIDFEVVLCMSK